MKYFITSLLLIFASSPFAGQFFITNNCQHDIILSVVNVGGKNCSANNINIASFVKIPQCAGPERIITHEGCRYTVQLAYGLFGAQICKASGKEEIVDFHVREGMYKGCYCSTQYLKNN